MATRFGLSETKFFTAWRLACLTIVIISILVYLPAMPGLLVWDDKMLVGGTGIGGGDSLLHCFTKPFLGHYFRPFISVSFYIERLLWSSTPYFYHQTNIIFHALTTWILILTVRALFQKQGIALLSGLIFAVHPSQVSTVGWIGGRTDSLSTLFLSIYLLGLIKFVRTSTPSRYAWLTLSVVGFFSSLMSKEQCLTLLPLAPLAVLWFGENSWKQKRTEAIRVSYPFLLVSFVFITAWLYISPTQYKMNGVILNEQLVIGAQSVLYYSLLLVMPNPQWMHLLTPVLFERIGMVTVLIGYALLLFYGTLFFRWASKDKPSAFFLAYIILALFPILNFIPLPSLLLAPYRAGTATLGACVLLATTLVWAMNFATKQRLLGNRRENDRQTALSTRQPKTVPAMLVGVGGAAFIVWCGGLTVWGNTQWLDEKTIFATISHYDPYSIVARFNNACLLSGNGSTAKGIHEMESVLQEIYGSDVWDDQEAALQAFKTDKMVRRRVRESQGSTSTPEQWIAGVYAQLGSIRGNSNDLKGADRAFQTGIALDYGSHDCYVGLAKTAYIRQDYPKALRLARIAIADNSERVESTCLMANAYIQLKMWKQALPYAQKWVKLQSWNGDAYLQLALSQKHLGDLAGAKQSLQTALAKSICDKNKVNLQLAALHQSELKTIRVH